MSSLSLCPGHRARALYLLCGLGTEGDGMPLLAREPSLGREVCLLYAGVTPTAGWGCTSNPTLPKVLKQRLGCMGLPPPCLPSAWLARSTKRWQAGGPGLREVERALSASRPGQLHCARLAWGPGLPSH